MGGLPETEYSSRFHVLGAGFLASQDPAQILFKQRQKVLVAERSAGTLMRAEGFQLVFSDGAGQQTAPVGAISAVYRGVADGLSGRRGASLMAFAGASGL